MSAFICGHYGDGVCPKCCSDNQAELAQVKAERDELAAQVVVQHEAEQLQELQHKREVEAIQRWQEEDPSRGLTMPDYGRLLDWLKDRLDRAEAREKWLVEALEEIIEMHPELPSPRALRALLAEIEGGRDE